MSSDGAIFVLKVNGFFHTYEECVETTLYCVWHGFMSNQDVPEKAEKYYSLEEAMVGAVELYKKNNVEYGIQYVE